MTTAHDARAAQLINEFASKRMGERMNQNDAPVVARQIFSLMPQNFTEALEFAKLMASTDIVPKEFRGKPENVLVAVQMGAEVGLPPMQALQNIAIINGKPVIYGDALWALVKNHPFCESTDERFDDGSMTATCIVKRRGSPAVIRTFSKTDAEKARLWGKEGPWTLYPKRMLSMRARSWACRDALPEALKGLRVAEEQTDIEKDITHDSEQLEPLPGKHIDTDTGEITRREPAGKAITKSEPIEAGENKPAGDAPRITAGALRILNQKLADKQLHALFCEHFDVIDPADLPMGRVNEAMQWVAERGKE